MLSGGALLGVGGSCLAELFSATWHGVLTVPSACPTAIWLAAGEAAIWVTSPATLPDWDMGGTSVLTCRGKAGGGDRGAGRVALAAGRQAAAGGGRRGPAGGLAAALIVSRAVWAPI